MLVCFGLLLTLYSLSGTLSHWFIKQSLQQAGFHHIHINNQRPNFTSWEIPALRAENSHFSVKLQHVSLHYSFTSLLSGNITQLNIQQASIQQASIQSLTPPTSPAKQSSPSRILPTSLWLDLPISQVHIQQLSLDMYAYPAMHISGTINMDKQQLQAHLRVHKNGLNNNQVHIQLNRAGTFKAHIRSEQQDVLSVQMQLDHNQQRWRIEGQSNIHIPQSLALLHPWLQHGFKLPPQLQSSGSIQAQWQVELPLQQPLKNFTATVQTSGYIQIAQIPPLQHLQAGLNTHIFCNSMACDWSFLADNQVSARLIHSTQATPNLSPIHISVPQTLHGTVSWQNQQLALSIQSGQLAVSPLQYQQFSSQTITIQPRLQLNQQHLQASFDIQSEQKNIRIQAKLNHHWQEKSGKLNITLLPVHLSSQNDPAQFITPTPAWGIDAGTARMQSSIQWQQGKVRHHQSRIQLQALAGFIQDTRFSNLNSDLIFHGNSQYIQSEQGSYLSIQNIHATLPIHDLYSQIGWHIPLFSPTHNQPKLELANFQLQLLGGNISSPLLVLDLNQEESPLNIQVNHIQLNEIMKLRQQDDLFASGTLSGQLPLRWTQHGLMLDNGTLHASQAGGIIRYQPDASVHNMAANNSSIQIMLDALDNFHYQQLQSTLHYQANGQMLAKIQLSGSNPDFQDGQSIHLNLNIEENILQLIRSLQISGKVSEQLDKKIQQTLQP